MQEVLENFPGTILLVSHDRYLIDRLASQVWELRDNHMHVFGGTYAEFLIARETARGKAKQVAAGDRTSTRQKQEQGRVLNRRSKSEERQRGICRRLPEKRTGGAERLPDAAFFSRLVAGAETGGL